MTQSPGLCVTRRPACLVSVAAVLSALLVGCAGWGPLPARLREDVVRPERGVVLFICDGLCPDLVEEGCRAGWLPNINKRFFEGGTRVENALAAVPSVTYAAITTLLTGVSPATHRIAGNRWFDPDERLFRDYAKIRRYRYVNSDFDVPTIYERIAPLYSVSIQAPHTRGVSRNIANWAQSGARWYFQAYTGVDALTAETVAKVAWEANWAGHWPAMLTCYFPGADTIGHRHGASSPEYRAAVEHLDHALGRVCNWLESENLLQTTYIALVSDHGMVDVRPDGYIDLLHLIRDEWGRNATDRMLQKRWYAYRRSFFDRYDTVLCHQDGRKALLYFAGPSGWDERPAYETVEQILSAPPPEKRLWNLAGIGLVAYLAGAHEAVIRSPRGAGRIVERPAPAGPEYRYVPVPDDLLGYQDDPALSAFVAEGFHSSRAWLHATCHQESPDLVPHVIPLLRERRFGQVLIFPSPGYSFDDESGGHGGIHRDETRSTMMYAGPGIEPGSTIECARAVDLTPTLMTLLGVALPSDGSIAGVALFRASGQRSAFSGRRVAGSKTAGRTLKAERRGLNAEGRHHDGKNRSHSLRYAGGCHESDPSPQL